MTIEEVIKVLEMQEEILQFTHFTNDDAWELGSLIVTESKKRGLSVAVSIRLNNGLIPFQYFATGRCLNNDNWVQKKHNTVKMTEQSSLLVYSNLQKNGEVLEDMGLDPKEYAACGGGFPLRIEEVGVIGTITVSGLDHVSDHDLLIKCISKYLHVDEVARIKAGML
ncbi:heme-degrading domain-containing protein [Anaerosacchariphilus polymeriproducens]|uniref:Heme-degrading domain-containing protein n=1 Tax=Anaerosacchariphilus polymeriproducens TaxID=1812858 RepID=A0A371AUQ9_9FIRM|nr:heme-degrading domain-containing protein [Anaerosacchariphilus polymeriproducens]RDU23305.1 heme-degrading domain-containing protein [Anaerosacchariphilus polymeriproducens]